MIYIYTVLFATTAISAQGKYHFVTSKKVAYLKTRNANLEKALRKWNGTEGEAFKYHYNTVDLNDDS